MAPSLDKPRGHGGAEVFLPLGRPLALSRKGGKFLYLSTAMRVAVSLPGPQRSGGQPCAKRCKGQWAFVPAAPGCPQEVLGALACRRPSGVSMALLGEIQGHKGPRVPEPPIQALNTAHSPSLTLGAQSSTRGTGFY